MIAVQRSGKYYLAVYLIVFCAFFDTHAQMPVLTPYALSLGATPFILGLIIGAYSFSNICGNFIGGAAIDTLGWSRPLLIGLFGASLLLFSYTVAENAAALIYIRAGHGLAGGILIPSALACLAGGERSEYSKRMAAFGATVGLAAISGPMSAGLIASRLGYASVYYFLAALLFIAAVISLPLTKYKPVCGANAALTRESFTKISAMPSMKVAYISAFGLMGATGTLAAFLPVRTAGLGFGPAETGILFTIFAFQAILVQAAWPTWIMARIENPAAGCLLGLPIIAASLLSAGIASTFAALAVALAVYGTGFGLSFQGMLGLVMEGSESEWRGRAIGLFFAAYSIGAALLPPLGGLIWQNIIVLFPFYTASLFTLLSWYAAFSLNKKSGRNF